MSLMTMLQHQRSPGQEVRDIGHRERCQELVQAHLGTGAVAGGRSGAEQMKGMGEQHLRHPWLGSRG